ncbi:MAG TPA: Calx-beta domain-containing protein, partial [Pyrinomonadaceae bacterium]
QGSVTMNVTVQGNLSDNPHPTNGLAGFYAEVGALAGDTSVLNLLVGGAGAAENNFVDGDPFNGTDVLLSRIAGAGTSLNLSRGVSAASSVQQIITDNNVDPVTAAGAGTITFVNTVPALPPATDQTCSAPSAPLNMDVTDDFVGVLGVPTQASLEAPSGGVTSRPFVSPRPTARKATAPVATAAQARTTTTRPAAQGNVLGREAAPATKKAASTGVPTEPIVVMGAGGNVSVNIGTLRAGDSVTITFRVTIDNPYSGPPAVSNQGTVTADGGISVLTDDPTEAGSNNPTVTPVNSLNIFARDGEASEPTSGTTPLLFTVTLSSPAPLGGVAVNYTTADGGATPATGGASCGGAVDYETKAGTLSFAAGERVKTVSVNVCADNAAGESDETLLLNLSGATGGNVQVAQATGTITQGTTPGTFLISELRTSGPAGSNDEFVELYNNTDTPLTVAASDATAGYGVFTTGGSCDATPVLVGTIPNGTVIPARGHYLMVGTAYSLANYGGTGAAAGDLTMSSDLPNDGNVAVFTTADVGNISSSARLDAVGFGTNTGGGVCDLLREGNTLSPVAGSTTEHSFFRQQCDYVNGVGCTVPGNPKDTNDNAADFLFADTQGSTITGVTQRLGAPGPENLASPIRRDNTGLNAGLLDSTKPSSAEPNRHREIASGTNATFGTLSIRRRVTNNTGSPVTRLRFRIVELTTFPSPGNGQADLRALSSSSVSVSSVNDPATCPPGTTPCTVTVQGTTLETPPSQPEGGGYNSTLAAGTVTTAAPLAPGASINLQFVLGIETTGKFRFYIIVEALP